MAFVRSGARPYRKKSSFMGGPIEHKNEDKFQATFPLYGLPYEELISFLRGIFGNSETEFHVTIRSDRYHMLLPRMLTDAEKAILLNFCNHPFWLDQDGGWKSRASSPRSKSSVSKTDKETFKSQPSLDELYSETLDREKEIPLIKHSDDDEVELPSYNASMEEGVKDQKSITLLQQRTEAQGHYHLLYHAEISRGLTSEVFQVDARFSWVAKERVDERGFKLAVKKLSKSTTVTQFFQEYNSLRAVTKGNHRNIVDLLSVFRYEDADAVVSYNFSFPLAPGNLKQLLRLTGSTPSQSFGTDTQTHRFSKDFLTRRTDCLWTEFGGLASALQYLHDECGIVHSDIKPSNILLYEMPDYPYVVTKLTDFGLAVDLGTKLTWQLGTHEAESAWQYDAPEIRSRMPKGLIDSKNPLLPSAKVLKSGDIWKLASVFTELLSFLTLGYRGVPEFRDFITTTFKQLTSDELSDTRFDDGTVVKNEVLEWLSKLDGLNCRARELTPLLRRMLDKTDHRPSAAEVAHYVENSSLSLQSDGIRLVQITAANYVPVPSRVDLAKHWFETWLGGGLDWWPLSQGDRLCPPGHSRISWQWSQETLYVDVLDRDAAAYQVHCRPISATPNMDMTSPPPSDSLLSLMRREMRQEIAQKLNSTPNNTTARRSARLSSTNQANPLAALNSVANANNTMQPQTTTKQIHWCVDKAWSEPRVTQLRSLESVHQYRDDQVLCEKLAAEYRKARGWKGRLLSWKSCLGVDFIKFTRAYHGQDQVVRMQTGLPASRFGYEYSLVRPEEVHMRIAAAQLVAGLYQPQKANGLRSTMDMIPKHLDNQTGLNAGWEGWGVHALQRFSLWKILAWMAFLTVLGLIFVVLWLVFIGRTDLQNAFVPFTFLSTMVLIGLGVPQLLDVD